MSTPFRLFLASLILVFGSYKIGVLHGGKGKDLVVKTESDILNDLCSMEYRELTNQMDCFQEAATAIHNWRSTNERTDQ